MATSLRLKQGDTWDLVVGWYNPLPGTTKPDLASPINMTGYTARLQIRAQPGDIGTPMLALTSTPAAGLTVNAAAGTVTVRATPAQTAVLPTGVAYWECEITNGIDVRTLAEGPITVEKQVVI